MIPATLPACRCFVSIAGELVPVDTLPQIEAAQRAMRAAAIAWRAVYTRVAGSSSALTTGQVLYADAATARAAWRAAVGELMG